MKCFFLFALSAFLLSLSGHSQTVALPAVELSILECIYKLTYRPDSLSNKTGTDIQLLTIGKTLSKFESRSFHLHDSVLTATPNLTQENAQAFTDAIVSLPRVTTSYTFYKIAAMSKLYCYDRIGTTLYTYKEPDHLFKWTLTKDTATIAGYACQRAVTDFAGRTWQAWFTRSLPISEGPYKFHGLPGLIVKIGDTRNHFIYELIKLAKPKSSRLIAFPASKGIFTTQKDLRRGKASYNATTIDRVAAMGNEITPEEKQAAKVKAAKRTNPLELGL